MSRGFTICLQKFWRSDSISANPGLYAAGTFFRAKEKEAPEQIRNLSALYLGYAEKKGKRLGVHAHNNQQLAFANTIEAIRCGAGFADATCDGMGRGAGNCSMEMLVGYLKDKQLQELPILEFIEKHLIPMKEAGVRWGYELPYLLTGQGRVHPSRAIQFIQEGCKDIAGMFAQIAAGQ